MSEEPPSDPAAAFEILRAEIALMRRGVEQLAAERVDFRPTLDRLVERQDNVAEVLKRVYNAPPIKLTPAEFAQDFSRATEHLRAQDREAIAEADRAIQRAIGKIEAVASRGNTLIQQRRRLIQSALAGAGAAVILWSILPGAIARALPQSWHVPEWMATRTMALSEREAGQRLLQLAKQRGILNAEQLGEPTTSIPTHAASAAARVIVSDSGRQAGPPRPRRERSHKRYAAQRPATDH